MQERRSRFKLQDAEIGLPAGLKGRTSSTEAALAPAIKRSEGTITAELTETSPRSFCQLSLLGSIGFVFKVANERLKFFWEKMDEAVRERNLEMIIFLCARILSCFDLASLQEKEPRTINIDE